MEEVVLNPDGNYGELARFKPTKEFDDTWFAYDIEVFSNLFTLVIVNIRSGKHAEYRICLQDPEEMQMGNFRRLKKTLNNFRSNPNLKMVGFRNLSYDYPVLHHLIVLNPPTPKEFVKAAKWKNDEIIHNTHFMDNFKHMIWENQRHITQVDLEKLHHFDNSAKKTSLKALEFEMRLPNIQEAPVDFNKPCPHDKVDEILHYNVDDVVATSEFVKSSLEEIQFRLESKAEHPDHDWLNWSDSKIGSMIMQLAYQDKLGWKAIYKCDKEGKLIKNENNKAIKKQTPRLSIDLGEVILPYISFKSPEFQAITEWFENTVITETKGALTQIDPKSIPDNLEPFMFKDAKGNLKVKREAGVPGVPNLHCIKDGLTYIFGTGGLHASVHNRKYDINDDVEDGYRIVDWDVTSYYPSLSIVNRLFPEHLGEEFCNIYADLKSQRMQYNKGTMMNKALKLALNSVYGNSNNHHSIFYDPMFTMAITINGQLSLCMLVEMLESVEGFEMIQANTDGITFKMSTSTEARDEANRVSREWQALTGLELESAEYNRMWIANVNNYMAEYKDADKIKRKGRQFARLRRDSDEGSRELQFHQDQSNLISKKAAELYMRFGTPVEETIKSHKDPMDFCKRVKINRSSMLIEGDLDKYDIKWSFKEDSLVVTGDYQTHQKVNRYYVSKSGSLLTKWMPPRKKALSLGIKEQLLNVDFPDLPTKKALACLARDPNQWTEEFTMMCEMVHESLQRKEEPDYDLYPERYREVLKKAAPKASPTTIEAKGGYRCKVINHTNVFDLDDIDYEYYIEEAKKLIIE